MLVRYNCALIAIAAILTNPAWVLLVYLGSLNLTWLQLFGSLVILQFSLAAQQQFHKIDFLQKSNPNI
jgi:hypothetical protein